MTAGNCRCHRASDSASKALASRGRLAIRTPAYAFWRSRWKGKSLGGQGPDGRPMARSYGSMTYGGLKSMIYAGLSKDDPRVKAAWSWIRKNWSLAENPGMRLGDPRNAEAGLFYYRQTFAKALAADGEPTVTEAKGAAHDW